MIPEYAVTQWQENVPWIERSQVEQDLLISKALVLIYNDPYLKEHLAFRGGTALHKLYLSPQPRYSEDLDLVQVNAEPVKDTYDRFWDLLTYMGKPKVKQKLHNNTLIYRMESSDLPPMPLRLKVEINCKEHFSILPMVKVLFKVENQWFTGECEVLTYQLEELIGTKVRALYQRRKGRDLFDLYQAINKADLNLALVIECYREYMDFVVDHIPTQKEYLLNMEEKMADPEFLGDTVQLLRPELEYDPIKAYEIIKKEILEKL